MSFISSQAFQKFSYAHFALFSSLHESIAVPDNEHDDSDDCPKTLLTETKNHGETETPSENGKQCADVGDPFLTKFSSVSSEERKIYFLLKKLIKNGKGSLNDAQKKDYDRLHPKIMKEQRLYMNLLETFCKKNPLTYTLNAEADKYIQELLISSWEEPLKYSRYYATKYFIPFISTVKKRTSFEHLRSVLQLGDVHYLNLPSMRSSCFLNRTYDKLCRKYPPRNTTDNWLEMPVSKDPNARMLSAKYGADFVMSFGSLATLFANHELCMENSWEMPVVVVEKDSDNEETEKRGKLVFIDKPFLKTNLTVFEKNVLYQKRALKEFFLCPKHKSSVKFSDLDQATTFIFDKKQTCETVNVPVDDFSPKSSKGDDLTNLAAHEKKVLPFIMDESSNESNDSTIGQLVIDVGPNSPEPDKSEVDISESAMEARDLNVNTESGADVRRSSRLREKSIIKEETLKQKNESKGPKKRTVKKNPLEEIEELQKATFETFKNPLPESTLGSSYTQSLEPEDPSNFVQPPPGWNVCYQLWKIGNAKVLVRSSVAGVSKFGKNNRFWQLTPKIEYQPKHGAQSFTFNEYVNRWISTVIVPNVSLATVRINAFNYEVVGMEELDLHKVIPQQILSQISECISNTATMLAKLFSLSCGNYLISHSPNEGTLKILEEVHESERSNCSNLYDLHLKYFTTNTTNTGNAPEVLPWLPIDPNVLFFRHKKACCIPALFRTKDCKRKKANTNFKKGKAVKS